MRRIAPATVAAFIVACLVTPLSPASARPAPPAARSSSGVTWTLSSTPPTLRAITRPTLVAAGASPKILGSLPVGEAKYTVPTGAVFVAPGSVGGSGTASSPYLGLGHAIAAAPSGSTLVLKAGTYHESVKIPMGKRLTLQNAPGAAVWLDGSETVTGWTRSGSAWVHQNWAPAFDHRVSFTAGADETARWVDSSRPLAGYPDQLFLGDVPLRQVGAASALTPGTFAVDVVTHRLSIGSDPTGRVVRASSLQKAVTIQGSGSVVRGIGIRRYAPTVSMFGAISAEVPGVTLENLVVTENATIGVFGWASGHRFKRLTVTRNGLLGIGLNKANNFSLTDSIVSDNNTEGFKQQPVSGGVKMAQSNGVTFARNDISGNATTGLWFDMSTQNVVVDRNRLTGNGGNGLEFEASDSARIVGNTVMGNAKAAIQVFDSSRVEIWNNTIAGGPNFGVRVVQDSRRSGDPLIPWVVSAVRFRNNVIQLGTSPCPVLVDDLQDLRTAAQMGVTTDGNLYHRAGPTSPANLACLAAGAKGFVTYKTLSALRTGTGADQASRLVEGSAILKPDGSFAATLSAATVGVAVPTTIAPLLGVSTGWVGVGAR